jgi:hypothetical protein
MTLVWVSSASVLRPLNMDLQLQFFLFRYLEKICCIVVHLCYGAFLAVKIT